MRLLILGVEVEVIEVEGLNKDDNLMGECDFDKKLIRIDAALDGEVREHTLHHEVCHWILYRSGISNLVDEKLEEALCDVIAFGFTELRQV